MDIDELTRNFRDRISDATFPCVGAKSALSTGMLKVVKARDIQSAWNDVDIHRALIAWCDDFREDDLGLRSLAVVFKGPLHLSETAFEVAMWDRLQSLADKDAWLDQPYDDGISADPEDPHFSLSFGGCGFFVVGLHPNASRPARRFSSPALVFNLHAQFERLREEGKYVRMRERIMERDTALAGSPNPMLTTHGETSEARQYSGRAIGPEWECPFRDPRG